MTGSRFMRGVLVVPVLLLVACGGAPKVPWSKSHAPLVLADGQHGSLRDERARFREIYCALTRDHGKELPDYMPCYEALMTIGEEPPPPGRPVPTGQSRADSLALLVPGLGFQCIRRWLLDEDYAAPHHVARYGYDVDLLEVNGLSSSAHNAREVRDAVLALDGDRAAKPLVLIGYSKGLPDLLEALVAYPELAARVQAVVGYAGAAGGSPLADVTSEKWLNLLTWFPGDDCENHDGGALASLRTDVRRAWLADNPLPEHIRYYSVVAFPEETRISGGLKPSWRKIGRLEDARNDSQLTFYDQVIPGSTLLAFVNADHWAMAVPVARHKALSAATVAGDNEFPREIMLEAILRFLEEDLASGLD